MVLGEAGDLGPSVPRAVVEELRPGGDSVTVQPRPRGGQTVRGINIRRDSATLINVAYQVQIFKNSVVKISCNEVMLYKLIPVNGQWGSWRVSGKCSKTCGGGSQYLARNCDSPPPANGGNYCRGDHSQYKQCNTHQCLVRGANIKLFSMKVVICQI